jgi:hypothetical protein
MQLIHISPCAGKESQERIQPGGLFSKEASTSAPPPLSTSPRLEMLVLHQTLDEDASSPPKVQKRVVHKMTPKQIGE